MYTVDAFTDQAFRGNPAAVCLNETWLKDAVLQHIAAEMNLSETAFLVPREDGDWDLRWFTPASEVDLCGHATLAAAHIIFSEVDAELREVHFHTRSGRLSVSRTGELLVMDFPSDPATTCAAPRDLIQGLGAEPEEVLASRAHYLAVYEREEQVRALSPDLSALGQLDRHVIATAPCAGRADFVSRFFAPRVGIPEDPVTGSAHCTLTPYWAQRLGEQRLEARQVSRRGGTLYVQDSGERVQIAGHAVSVLRGELSVRA